MPTLITAGDASAGLVQTASNDGALTLQTGPAGSKVNAINFSSAGAITDKDGNNLSPIGVGQTWQTFTVGTTRISGTTYTNNTGKPIMVKVSTGSLQGSITSVVAGVTITLVGGGGSGYNNGNADTFIVPNGATYSVTLSGGTLTWAELR